MFRKGQFFSMLAKPEKSEQILLDYVYFQCWNLINNICFKPHPHEGGARGERQLERGFQSQRLKERVMNCQYNNPNIQTGRVFLYGYSILSTAINVKPAVAIPILSKGKQRRVLHLIEDG
jgi:hypothetical protein